MITITSQEELDIALYAINLHLLTSCQWRLKIQGKQDVELNGSNFEFSLSFNKLIFSFWTEDTSQSWRVMSYQIKSSTLRMQVARQMGQSRATFEIRRFQKRTKMKRFRCRSKKEDDILKPG